MFIEVVFLKHRQCSIHMVYKSPCQAFASVLFWFRNNMPFFLLTTHTAIRLRVRRTQANLHLLSGPSQCANVGSQTGIRRIQRAPSQEKH